MAEGVHELELLSIDGQLYHRMIVSGANCLENNKLTVNSLNVFPVPDGDTGTNMSMTMSSAVKEIKKIKNQSIENITEAASNGSLMGARGNSGVILSQLLRGFARSSKGKNELNSKDMALAFKEGVNTAYKAVMKPTEGTILTVARESADKMIELSKSINDINILMDKMLSFAEIILDKTPDMLPVLKKAGVVDAGGKGLIYIYKGMIAALKGNDIVREDNIIILKEDNILNVDLEDEIKFGYCTEFIINTLNADINRFRELLSTRGDSLIVVGDANIIKVHIHTNNPGKVLSDALDLGELIKIKIDNMREQHKNIIIDQHSEEGTIDKDEYVDEKLSSKKAGIITVAMGEGIKNIFMDLGADRVIEGGQTMNPSTEDILNAVNTISASDIYILPNNGNIVMAAKQAASLTDKKVFVIPTNSIPQGIAALTVFNPDNQSNENIEIMTGAIGHVKTGQVTYAVRNTSFDNKEINEGDILGLINGKINNIGIDLLDVAKSLIESMVSSDDELITVLYGCDVSEADANILTSIIQKKYPDCDIQSYNGGQPLYYFIISVE